LVSQRISGFSPMLNSLAAIGVNTVFQGKGQLQSGHLSIDEGKLMQALMDPVGSAAITGRTAMPVQYNTFRSVSLSELTTDTDPTPARTVLGLSGTFTIEVGDSGTPVTIVVEDTYTLVDVRRAINDATAGVTATISNNQLILTSNTMGEPGKITMVNTSGSNPPPLSVYDSNKDIFDLLNFQETATVSSQNYVFGEDQGGRVALEVNGKYYNVNMEGPMTAQDIEISFVGAYNRGDAVNRINNAISKLGQAYLDENDHLVIRSLQTGESSSVQVVRVDINLAELHLNVGQRESGGNQLVGLAVALDRFYESWVISGGILNQKQNSLGKQINDVQKQMDTLTARIDARVEFLWKQFSNMEQRLQSLNAQSQWIDIHLANLMNNTMSMNNNK